MFGARQFQAACAARCGTDQVATISLACMLPFQQSFRPSCFAVELEEDLLTAVLNANASMLRQWHDAATRHPSRSTGAGLKVHSAYTRTVACPNHSCACPATYRAQAEHNTSRPLLLSQACSYYICHASEGCTCCCLLLLAGIRPTKFHNNTSQYGGGHICIYDTAVVRIIGAEFLDGGGPLIGGAVQLSKKSVVRMHMCSIKDCTAQSFGGGVAVFDDAQLKMSSCSITGCSSPGHGGGLYAMDRSKVRLSNATSIANCSATNGGGMFLDGAANLAMLESRVVNCSTQDGQKASAGTGGGILVSGNAGLLINASVVADCVSPAHHGGGVAAWERSQVFVVNSSILDNMAGKSGGGLYALGPDVQVGLQSSNFTGNVAMGHGGGVYMNEGGLLYLRGKIHATGNKALISGGGMALGPALVNISDGTQPGSDNLSAKSLFKAIAATNNTAKAYAPDISILAQKIQIVNSTGNLDSYVNSIDSKGGLLYITLNVTGVSGLPSDEPIVWEALDGSAVQYYKRTTLISGVTPSQPGEVLRRIPISLRRPPGVIPSPICHLTIKMSPTSSFLPSTCHLGST